MENTRPDKSNRRAQNSADEPALRDVFSDLSCACLGLLRLPDAQKELFRRIELDGQSLELAARALDLEVDDARGMLGDIRCQLAAMLVLSLFSRPDPTAARSAPSLGCRCSPRGQRSTDIGQDRGDC